MKNLVQIKAKKSKRSLTRDVGVSLVELLVSIAISGFLAICLSESLSAQMRMSTITQSRLLAAQFAKSTVDRLRMTSFSRLPPTLQTTPIKISSEELNTTYPVLDRPLQIDATNLLWAHADPSNMKPGSTFKGTAQIVIADSSLPDTKTVQVTVTWREPGTTEDKTYVLTSLIHRYGIRGDSQW
ncbi:MAG: hypothetical protein QG625_1603 [Cyanobacteriota bacterium erpe_2018_sw_39hr_WHONDRS-SW48-000098_B_bin.30]|jgi:type II secretory pathway pseudopilin PulG|nr:type II secretion system protein [Candidatus Obscuribacter sp.]MDQ5965448.1 hypothetical protein [Cyanobacteriota bacterium erpe_2018_sw_39hr_WHONDRS-SW48-000098_B_bin.30]